ncbi:hypothetical protein [Nocardia cyriacigeorgica]|uniref:hypothetical protein n=1 Tax=Nocardia cyriacigeorgica TaxID=135487 RepID=UPI0013D01E06|nr:hypothetical protein [Nocardia cyriacigeorgica]NEW30400.1 hypothetical protein [Nocardia cyriacigeorgica]
MPLGESGRRVEKYIRSTVLLSVSHRNVLGYVAEPGAGEEECPMDGVTAEQSLTSNTRGRDHSTAIVWILCAAAFMAMLAVLAAATALGLTARTRTS